MKDLDTLTADLQLGPEPPTVECPRCHTHYGIAEWPFCPHGAVYEQAAQHFDPVVYHVNAKGEVRFPGATDAPVPVGYERRELRTIGEVRRFQARVNAAENSKIRQQVERECAWLETVEAKNRSDLRAAMAQMSPAGRAFAEVALAQHNQRRPTSGEAGFYVEPFENDASNREAYRDARTKWQRRRS
jgi:hypothetical protein